MDANLAQDECVQISLFEFDSHFLRSTRNAEQIWQIFQIIFNDVRFFLTFLHEF